MSPAGSESRKNDAASEDLFRPTIEERSGKPTGHPWRITSQFYVAFLGGVPAITTIAYLNSARLGVSRSRRRLILALGAVALFVVLTIVFLWYEPLEPADPEALDIRRYLRWANQAVAILLYLALAAIQRPAERLFKIRGGDFESLWGPGAVAVLLSVLLYLALFAGVTSLK